MTFFFFAAALDPLRLMGSRSLVYEDVHSEYVASSKNHHICLSVSRPACGFWQKTFQKRPFTLEVEDKQLWTVREPDDRWHLLLRTTGTTSKRSLIERGGDEKYEGEMKNTSWRDVGKAIVYAILLLTFIVTLMIWIVSSWLPYCTVDLKNPVLPRWVKSLYADAVVYDQ